MTFILIILCICILFLIRGPVGRHQNFPDFRVFEHHCLRRSVLVLSCVVHFLVWRVGLEVRCHMLISACGIRIDQRSMV